MADFSIYLFAVHCLRRDRDQQTEATEPMAYLNLLLFLSFALPIFIHVFKSKVLGRRSLSLPPGPRPFPVLTLKLGRTTTIVISSPEFAKEALQKHGQALSGRTIPDAARVHDHYKFSVASLPPLHQWKSLRKIIATELFTSQKFEASENLRQRKVQELLAFVGEHCKNCQAINIGRAAFTAVLNLLSNTFFSIDLASYNSNKSQEFHDSVVGILKESGKPNLADYFPLLKMLDPQGIRGRANHYFETIFEVLDRIIKERLQQRSSSAGVEEKQDVLEFLLNAENSELALLDIKHLLADLFIAGTDTTAKTLEWGMAELLRNPEKLSKLKKELEEAGREIRESDIDKLPYLLATVKEIFRLHPAAPFLVPHKAEADAEIGDFKIPKNAQILVNVWAIGRDDKIWKDADRFEPERFLESKIDVKGRDFELIPFGAGRRICPGLPLAHRMLHLMLASLIQSFEWKLANGIKPEELDMTERFGLALFKAEPLLAVPYLQI